MNAPFPNPEQRLLVSPAGSITGPLFDLPSRHPSSVALSRRFMRPSLGEFTRRLLREEGVILRVPEYLLESCASLPNQVSNAIPSRLELPELETHSMEFISLYHSGIEIGRLSGPEPPLQSVWFNGDASEALSKVLELAEDFLAAGYPGCRDCLGPAALEPWDEKLHRNVSADKE